MRKIFHMNAGTKVTQFVTTFSVPTHMTQQDIRLEHNSNRQNNAIPSDLGVLDRRGLCWETTKLQSPVQEGCLPKILIFFPSFLS